MALLYPMAIVFGSLAAGCANPMNVIHYDDYLACGLAASRAGDYDRAAMCYSRAVMNARTGRLGPKDESRALYNYAIAVGMLCYHDLARDSFVEALRLEEEAEGPNGGSSSLRIFELARLNLDTGHYDQAVIWYERGIPLARSMAVDRSDPIGFANELDDFATALEHTSDSARAAELHKESAALRAEHPGALATFPARRYPTQCAKS